MDGRPAPRGLTVTFSTDRGAGDRFGLSVFLRDDGRVYRMYFAKGRAVDWLRFDMNMFDLTSLGQQEAWSGAANSLECLIDPTPDRLGTPPLHLPTHRVTLVDE